MFYGSKKWSLLTMLIICCCGSLGREVQKEDLMLVAKKINAEQFNLTCIAQGKITSEGLSLTGPKLNENFQRNNRTLYHYLQLNETLIYMDLPPVFDQQWEDFPTRRPKRPVTIQKNEYLWISVRYRQGLVIRDENNSYEFIVKCEENKSWVHLKFHSNSTHLSVKSDRCLDENSVALSNSNESKFILNSFYKEHRYNFTTITKNMNSSDIQGMEKTEVKLKTEKLSRHFYIFRLSYYLTCSSCRASVRVETNLGQTVGRISLIPQDIYKWNTTEVNFIVDKESHIGSTNEVVVTVLSEPDPLFALVIRNIFISEESVDHSISMLINSTDISQYICKSMESNVSVTLGSINSNDTKKDLRFPQSKLCYSNGNCYCSPGSRGDMCEQQCADGYWEDCSKECDCCNIENICNKVDGSCEKEEDCQKSRSVKSVILNSSSTSIIGNVNIQKNMLQKKINSMQVEYMATRSAIDSKENDWTMYKHEINMINSNFNISNLKPNTNYSIRTSLCANQKCFEEHGYISKITTKCVKPASSELNLEIAQNNVVLIYSNYSMKEGSCKQFLSISSNNKTSEHELRGLIAYTYYTIDIRFQGEIIDTRVIRTKTAKASKVRSLNFKESQGLLSWREPEHPNGNLGHYFVNITRLGSILCDDIIINQYETENLQLPIKVIPYSRYEVIVHASNEKGAGYDNKISFKSSTTDQINDNDRPIKFDINETHLDIEIHGCRYISGPWLIYESKFTCLDPDCENEQIISIVNLTYTQESKYMLSLEKSLDPYTNYKVQTSIYRVKDVKTISIYTGNITTLPQCPPPVRHLDVYSVSNSSISVRWKLPHPPRGVLAKIFFYFQDGKLQSKKTTIKNINMNNCSLWDDANYFCKTFEDINDQSFPILIIAKNLNTKNCKENNTLTKIQLRETSSEAPIDLEANWKGDMKELELAWKHPNKTNGRIKNFLISLKPTANESKDILEVFNISTESHHYKYSIKSFNKSTKYTVEVIPVNAVRGSPAKLEHEIITPPPYPVIDNSTTYSTHGNNLTVNISHVRISNRNCTILLIISAGNCDAIKTDTNTIIGRKDVDIAADIFIETITVDLNKEFNITDISMYKDISITTVVTNSFEGIFRNTSRCLLETKLNLLWASSSLYVLVGLLAFVLLSVLCGIVINYKYGFFKYSDIYSKIFRRERQNDIFPSMQRVSMESECLELNGNDDTICYEKLPFIPKSQPIATEKFLNYLKSAVKYGDECELYKDFNSIPLKLYDFGKIAVKNSFKNRYFNILPYEDNRVTLTSGRYINASFIQGYKTERAYIATQGPKLHTVNDFWEMVYEYNVSLIAMLCPLKEDGTVKCDQYWPDFQNKILVSRNLEIVFDAEKNCGVYIERTFIIKCDTTQRKVVQLQFTAWMDHQIPSSSQFLQEFLERFHKLHDYRQPAVVHCSAGSGRTGALILCDYLLKMEKDTNTLDFLLVLHNLRKQRTQMVQTKQQYHFAHVVIYKYLCIAKSEIPCDNNFEKNVLRIIETKETSKETIQSQLQSLENLQAVDVSTFNKKYVSIEAEDLYKNRDQHILPTYSGVIDLQATNQAQSTYINAIYVDGYNQSEKFIVTQYPLISSQGSTVADFWRLVFQTQPELIVSLEEQVDIFYPTDGELLINDYIKLKCVKKSQNQISTTFTIQIIMDNEEFIVKIMTPNANLETTVDGSTHFINFYNEYTSNYSHKEFTVLVTCLNGCKLSGVLVALDYMIENMLQQEICDVFLAVRIVRKTRPNFITSEEQYRFLYRCALEIRKSMCTLYSNII